MGDAHDAMKTSNADKQEADLADGANVRESAHSTNAADVVVSDSAARTEAVSEMSKALNEGDTDNTHHLTRVMYPAFVDFLAEKKPLPSEAQNLMSPGRAGGM